jgi:hypothetical protein
MHRLSSPISLLREHRRLVLAAGWCLLLALPAQAKPNRESRPPHQPQERRIESGRREPPPAQRQLPRPMSRRDDPVRNPNNLSPDERQKLRQNIYDVGRDVYQGG